MGFLTVSVGIYSRAKRWELRGPSVRGRQAPTGRGTEPLFPLHRPQAAAALDRVAQMTLTRTSIFALAALAATPLTAQQLTLYSGRGETLVAPIIQAFEQETGITVNVRYAGTAELAVLLQEEGDATPADLFWGQDPGALGAVVESLAALPEDMMGKVPAAYRDDEGRWIATSGRQRVMVVSTERLGGEELPQSILDLTDERYKGRVGWAPTNGSFQLHVTALRHELGEEATKQWLEGMIANEPVAFPNNTAIVQGVGDGEADIGLTNNYYLGRFLMSASDFPARNTTFADGDIGNLLSVAAIGVTAASDQQEEAVQFVEFLLSPQAQQFFASLVNEYPVSRSAILRADQPSMEALEASAPEVDLNKLGDLEGTLDLLREVGLL
jgi:iron(III) transport system substrate-binding protein